MAHVRYAKNCWGPFHTSTRPYTFRHPWTISSSSMRHLAIGHCMFDADHREPGILILFNRLPFIPSNILNSDLNIATFKTLKKAIWILMVCNICWTGWKSSNKYRNMYNCRAFRAFFFKLNTRQRVYLSKKKKEKQSMNLLTKFLSQSGAAQSYTSQVL